ncbi:MAG: hypothetical protein MUC88_23090 [Planctomycetes bacterium]|nr:hypothetical protein [Planctomycetota bacterium]
MEFIDDGAPHRLAHRTLPGLGARDNQVDILRGPNPLRLLPKQKVETQAATNNGLEADSVEGLREFPQLTEKGCIHSAKVHLRIWKKAAPQHLGDLRAAWRIDRHLEVEFQVVHYGQTPDRLSIEPRRTVLRLYHLDLSEFIIREKVGPQAF